MEKFLDILFVVLMLYFVFAIRRSMRMSKISVKLIEKYADDKFNPQLITDIFTEINNDWILRKILKNHDATERDILKLHTKLMQWGDFRKFNHRYIPITSFFNAHTLKYLLTHRDDNAKSLTQKMMNHFHI